MAEAVLHRELAKAFVDRLAQTQSHIDGLERIFQRLNLGASGKKCKAMEGLLEECEEFISADSKPQVRDAALIATAQRVEHYEKAAYGCVSVFARLLGYNQDAELLEPMLVEVSAANTTLTHLAVRGINSEAITPMPCH
jgi:ferritin-like metal-binding protein YciE